MPSARISLACDSPRQQGRAEHSSSCHLTSDSRELAHTVSSGQAGARADARRDTALGTGCKTHSRAALRLSCTAALFDDVDHDLATEGNEERVLPAGRYGSLDVRVP